MSLKTISPEQRKEMQEKAKETRLAKKEAGKNLKQDFLDETHWRALASKHGIRLPATHIPNSETKHIKRTCVKLGVDIQDYIEYCGCRTLRELVQLNPDYPVYVEIGFLLEWYEEKNQ